MISLIQLASDFGNWILRKDNPHQVTAEQLGTYSKADRSLDWFNANLMNPSVMPITSFGNLLWTPLNFSGSFEGSTRNESEWYCAMIADDEGAPTLLMSGTNGVREAVYYSVFTLDGNDKIVGHNPIGLEYRPTFLSSNEWITSLCQCSALTAMWGKLAGNASYNRWITITGGTLNPAGHAGAYFNAPAGVDENAVAIATKTHAFLFQPNLSTGQIQVYRCSIVDIQTKQAITWDALTSITTTGINNTYTTSAIKFADVIFGTAAQNPIFQIDDNSFQRPAFSRPMLWGDLNPATGVMTFRLVFAGQHAFNNSYTPDALGVAFTFDTNALTAATIPQIRGVTKLQSAPTQPGGYILTGPNAYWGIRVGLGNNGQPHDSACMGPDQVGFIIRYPNQDAGSISSFTVAEKTTPWDFWDYTKHTPTVTGYVGVIRRYPGPFGDSARGAHWLSTARAGVTTYSNGPDWKTRKRTFAVAPISIGISVEYKTQRLGTINGFQPTSRDDWDDKLLMGHCEYHTELSNGSNTLTVGMGRLWEGKLSEYTNVDANLNYSGNVAFTQAAWDSLKNAVKASAGTAAIPWASVSSVNMELQIFNDPALPCVGFLCGHNPATQTYYVTAFVFTPNARSGSVTSATLGRILTVQSSPTSNGVNARNRDTWIPTCVYKNVAEGYTTVSLVQAYANNAIGSNPNLAITLMLLPNAPDYRTDWQPMGWSNPWYFGFIHIGVVPGQGLGAYNMTANRALCGTGMVWQAFGKAKTLLEAWTITGPNFMVMSQQAPMGWFAYIGENIPMLMNGKYATLPSEAIDLTTVKANPANTSFYIYVEDTGGDGFEYVTYTAPQPETLTRCYVGLVVTDNTKIAQQFMVRIVRLGIYRLSTEQIGSGLPIVDGMASSPAALHWVKNG